ncbi:RNA polymerase sigma factor [Microbacterium thalassium]|uniref:RNA polymerase sigma-70 factor (ECF subfamily) n=1 Tax=Microbacterium thalassium TaxID=362649 RepID=A0A7X0FQ83_9MICO|nr:sigma-70 family RNA polymerase sigma factor [Microbacterium thalassium]MBB6391685.1 RNA polymerase sigma-70 factor (ECF subfamily) [Microbacterium thalassium]GLK24288.1 DNA-directed RNA polymerase sigma-70 factor [Microbacterium thalassium]
MSTDSAIIRRSVDDPRAFAEIFDRHARVVGAFAARRVGSDAAEDVLSETFLVAFRRRGDFDHRWESARPWLLGIATRLVRSHRAHEAGHWRALGAAAGEPGSDEGGLEAASERLDATARVRELVPGIAAVSARDRDTLLLYAWGDLTYEEVAVALGVPVGTVRSRLNRVRRRLGATAVARAGSPVRRGEEALDG